MNGISETVIHQIDIWFMIERLWSEIGIRRFTLSLRYLRNFAKKILTISLVNFYTQVLILLQISNLFVLVLL